MKKALIYVLMAIGMSVYTITTQAQSDIEDVPGGTGKRAYIDLNPASSTEIAPGVRTFFAWAKDPKSGTYFKFVSVEETLFEIFDRVTQSVVQGEKIWTNDSAIVVEGPILDDIFIAEILNAYKNSSRIKNEINEENRSVEEIERAIDNIEDEIKDLQSSIRDAKDAAEKKEIRKSISDSKRELSDTEEDLGKAISKRNEGNQKREKEYRVVESLLQDMRDAGFCYLKNHAFVAISDILTKELPTRVNEGSRTPTTTSPRSTAPQQQPAQQPQPSQQTSPQRKPGGIKPRR